MAIPASPVVLCVLQIDAAMQQFFDDASEFNQTANFVFNRGA
jgi:hypothetical protein